SASADQSTGPSPAFSDGGTKKLQSPFPMEFALQGRTVGLRVVLLIVGIAPEPFPGEIGRIEIVQIVVCLRRAPTGRVGRHRGSSCRNVEWQRSRKLTVWEESKEAPTDAPSASP